jgi:hypothetical protein
MDYFAKDNFKKNVRFFQQIFLLKILGRRNETGKMFFDGRNKIAM